MQALVQQTLDSVTRTNTTLAVMENKFNEAMRHRSKLSAGRWRTWDKSWTRWRKIFRAVRESVLDMNSRISKLDAKMADLQNLINTMRNPAPRRYRRQQRRLERAHRTGARRSSGRNAGCPHVYQRLSRLQGRQVRSCDAGVRDYLRYFGNTDFAPNVQFYIGDIYYRKADYDNALQAFDAVLEHYPDNSKTPDAHYMKGLSLLNRASAMPLRASSAIYIPSTPSPRSHRKRKTS